MAAKNPMDALKALKAEHAKAKTLATELAAKVQKEAKEAYNAVVTANKSKLDELEKAEAVADGKFREAMKAALGE